jgi:hypothetical protein
VKTLDLSSELVVLDWVYEPTLKHVNRLLTERASAGDDLTSAGRLETYSFQLALNLLDRLGYGPLTRPTMLRIGFRDICRDLDFHEGTAVRVVLGEHRVARAYLDYDANALVFTAPSPEPDTLLEACVLDAFPQADILRLSEGHDGGSVDYQVRLAFPASFAEMREELRTIRRGLGGLLARFEPERFKGIEQHLATFGSGDTLSRLRVRERRTKVEALQARHGAVSATVH